MYQVKVTNPNVDKKLLTKDNYLKNWLGETPALYTRNEAIRKATAFGGNIEKVQTVTVEETSIMIISCNEILPVIRQFMLGRELFATKDNPTNLIYSSDIFIKLKKELDVLQMENYDFKTKDEIVIQLEQLSQIITSEYVLINDMCFS